MERSNRERVDEAETGIDSERAGSSSLIRTRTGNVVAVLGRMGSGGKLDTSSWSRSKKPRPSLSFVMANVGRGEQGGQLA